MDLRSDKGVLGGKASMVVISRSLFNVTRHGEVPGSGLLPQSSFIYSSRAAIAAS